ncbi:MAG: hypothetical protein WA902_21175, partial [Thermosynechococcaceae cyanobacterium]
MRSEELKNYHTLYQQLITEMVSCAPSDWLQGTLIIERNVQQLTGCSLQSEDKSSQALISDALRSLCEQYAVCKNGFGSAPSWSKAIIHYCLDDDTVDLSVDGSFEYPNDFFAEEETQTVLDES